MKRQEAIIAVMDVYKERGGKLPSVVSTPFTDISLCTSQEKLAIGQAYNLKITSGTTATTFSPEANTELYQWLLFFGKVLMLTP
jgi:hypothetical protein